MPVSIAPPRMMPVQHDLKPSRPALAAGDQPMAAFRDEDDAKRCAHGLGLLRPDLGARVLEVTGAQILFGRYPWVVLVRRACADSVAAGAYVKGFVDALGEAVVLR